MTKYYLAPKGQVLLKVFFENTILLELYRDDIYLDDKRHIIKSSTMISREEVFSDIIKIIEEFRDEELKFREQSFAYETQDLYCKLWGRERMYIKLVLAFKISLQNYYKEDIPTELWQQIMSLEVRRHQFV